MKLYLLTIKEYLFVLYNSNLTLAELCDTYKDVMFELSAVVGCIVQLKGENNYNDDMLFLQYDSTSIHNRGLYINVKPKFYLKGEDEYAHIRYVQDIPKPLNVYISNKATNRKPVLIYTDNTDF